MSTATLLFLILRVTHVLLAAAWLGSMAFVVIFLMPALKETWPAPGAAVPAMGRRGINPYMSSLGGIVVLTGFWLYWRFTGGFDPALSATRSAMVFGTGGIAGLLALIFGGAVVGRNAKKMGALAGQAMSLPEGPERAALMAQADEARRKAAMAGKTVLLLQAVALVCMAIGHYI